METKTRNILVTVIGIAIVVGLFFIPLPSSSNGSITGEVISEGDLIKILVSDISSKAQFYDYEGIGYFAVKSASGNIKTAFNACDVCYRAKKGYKQIGDDMVCVNCGNYYAISGLGTQNLRGGGCWPGFLPSEVEGDYLIIKKSDLEEGRYRFT